MSDRIKIFGLIIIVAVLMSAAFLGLGGLLGYERGIAKCRSEVSVERDTVYIHDTTIVTGESVHDTITETKPVLVPYTIYVHDTVTDSLLVYLPMEWHHASFPDTADVWYHGIMSAIDSARFYNKTKVITNTITETKYKMPRMTADFGAAAFYSMDKINPCLFGEVRYNRQKTTFAAFGAINHEGVWAAGGSVTYRVNLVK